MGRIAETDYQINGQLGVGAAAADERLLVGGKSRTSATTVHGLNITEEVQSAVTNAYQAFNIAITVQAASFTLGSLNGLRFRNPTIGAGATVNNIRGFTVDDITAAATQRLGYRSQLSSGSGKWNFYGEGTAANAFVGDTWIGSVTAPTAFAPSGKIFNLFGDGVVPRVNAVGCGADVSIAGYGSSGSLASPTAAASGREIRFEAWYYDGDSWERAGWMGFTATQTHSNSQRGTEWSVYCTPNGSTTLTKFLHVTHDGRLYGRALHNNAGALTGTTDQYVGHTGTLTGSYALTATGVTNVAAVSVSGGNWTRNGNVVEFIALVSLDATSSATQTEFRLSLPIASNFANAWDGMGTGSSLSGENYIGLADAALDQIVYSGTVQTAAAHSVVVTGRYEVK